MNFQWPKNLQPVLYTAFTFLKSSYNTSCIVGIFFFKKLQFINVFKQMQKIVKLLLNEDDNFIEKNVKGAWFIVHLNLPGIDITCMHKQ